MKNNKTIQKAKAEGYIKFTQQGKRLHYLHSKQDFPMTPEEEVRLDTYLQLVFQYGYPPECIVFERKVKMGSGYKFVDIVVFSEKTHETDFLLVECKRRDVSKNAFKEAEKQAFSYDKQLHCAQYIWVTSGKYNSFYRCKPNLEKGRAYFTLNDIPRFSVKDRLSYKIKENVGFFTGGFSSFFKNHIKPQFQKPWAAKFAVYSLLFLLLGLASSWLTERLVLPFILKETNLLSSGKAHLGHIYWVVPILATLVFVVIVRKNAFPSLFKRHRSSQRRGRKKRRSNRKVAVSVRVQKTILVSIALLAPSLFLTEIAFGLASYCAKCVVCKDWACWWAFRHYQNLDTSWEFTLFFLPFCIGIIPQVIMTFLASWVVEALYKMGD